ncbi:MAG: o-succinylbenzoate synthase [Melioribacteraceae bacterium]
MTISEFKYIYFSLDLQSPFHTSTKTISQRSGFIIELRDEFNNRASGECSPLPGFSSESLDDSKQLLESLQTRIPGEKIDDNFESVQVFTVRHNLTPSLRFAFEQALVNLLILRNRKILSDYFDEFNLSVPSNAVVGIGSKDFVLNKIRRKIRDGFTTFKIKIGRNDVLDDFLLLKEIRNEFGGNINLRLDANRAWSADEALEYLDRFQQFNIDYVEEPCEFVCSNFHLIEDSPVPIALDESLVSFERAEDLINHCNVEFLILKPMILGGILSSLKLIKEAEKKKKKIIISSSFESPVGKNALVFLAASVNHSLPHGLDTSDYFKNSLFPDPYVIKNGRIDFNPETYPNFFDLKLL